MSKVFASVKIEGEEVADLLQRLSIEESDSLSDLAVLSFGDSREILSDVLHEGLDVEIAFGWREMNRLMLRGMITSVRAHFPDGGQATVEIQALDSLIRLGLRPRSRSHWNTTLGEVVRDVARAHGLTPGDVTARRDEAFDEHRPAQQLEETDLAFLHRLADDHDCKLFVEHKESGDALSFVATEDLLRADPVLTLTYRENLRELTATFDAFAAAQAERLVSTDPLSGDRVEIRTELATARDAQWTPDRARIARIGEGSERIQRLLAKSERKRGKITEFWRIPPRVAGAPARPGSESARVLGDRARRLGQTAVGHATGDPRLRPRARVTIAGCNARWAGAWYVARVRHQADIGRDNYTSSFVCTR